MAKSSKVDKAIITANYVIKKKKSRIEEMSRRVDLNENQRIFIGEETELIQVMETLITEAKKGFDIALGKLPAQATDIEEAVLGAVMLESGTKSTGEPPSIQKVISFLLPEHFYLEQHKLIYTAIYSLAIAGHPVDMRTVVDQLRKTGNIEAIGGAYYVAEITSKVSSAASIDYHARILVELAIKRQVGLLSGNCLHGAYDLSKDCFVLLQEMEEGFKEINGWIKQ